MLKVTMTGFDEVQKGLQDLADRAQEMDGKQEVVPLTELMPDEFVAEHSSFESLEALFAASPFKIETPEDFAAIPDAEWDTYIASKTSFSTWEDMQHAAVGERIKKALGL